MTTSLQIFSRIIARPAQVTDGFLFRRRRPHLRQQSRAHSLSLRASRRFVLTRSPGFRGMSAGAITWQLTRGVVICRCNA
jgi:hypothetical protein